MTTPTQRLAFAAALCIATTGSFAQGDYPAETASALSSAQVSPNDYKVFVDAPTGYAFIKIPTGWKFMKQLDNAQVKDALAMEVAGTPLFAVAHLPSVELESSSVALLSAASTF